MMVVHTPESLGVGVGGLHSSCKNLGHHSCLWSQEEVSLPPVQLQTVLGCFTPASRNLGDLHTTLSTDASALAAAAFNKFMGGVGRHLPGGDSGSCPSQAACDGQKSGCAHERLVIGGQEAVL